MTAELGCEYDGAKMPFVDVPNSYVLDLVPGAWLQIQSWHVLVLPNPSALRYLLLQFVRWDSAAGCTL